MYDARSDAPVPYGEEIYLPPTDTGSNAMTLQYHTLEKCFLLPEGGAIRT